MNGSHPQALYDFSPETSSHLLFSNSDIGTKFARSTIHLPINNMSSVNNLNINMNPTSILIPDLSRGESNNMPRFLLSDEMDLFSSSNNLFFDPISKKREVSNSLEKIANDKFNKDSNSENEKEKKILSYNISKKGMNMNNITDDDEIEEEAEDSPTLIMNSPSEKYI